MRLSPDRRRLAAYVCVVAFGAVGFWRLETTVNRLDEVVKDNESERCVDSWNDRQQIREAIPIPNEALIEVVTDADPADVDHLREATARRIAEKYPDPDCDLAAAQARLDQ
jgi:hypothetical protein